MKLKSKSLPFGPLVTWTGSIFVSAVLCIIREIKFDVTWSYVKRQTAKMTFEFVFLSSNPLLNHINIEKCLLLFATNTNIFTLLFEELNTDGKSFIFAVCRLTYDHVTSNLISLLCLTVRVEEIGPEKRARSRLGLVSPKKKMKMKKKVVI